MRVPLLCLLLLVVGLARADNYYDGEYDDYDYDDVGDDFDYPEEETHRYPDEHSQRGSYYPEERPEERSYYAEERPEERPYYSEEKPEERPYYSEERPEERPYYPEERPEERPYYSKERPEERPYYPEERPEERSYYPEERPEERPYYPEHRTPYEQHSPEGQQSHDVPTYQEINGQETLPEAVDDGHICAQTCRISGDEDVVYEPGMQYRYQYQGQVVTRSKSTQSEESRMSVRSYVIITARTQCDLKMQVMNLAVDDVPSQDSQWFKDAVERYDLHFSYNDGMVSYLCPNEEEEVAATNFKRGILSAIQAKVTNIKKPKAIVYESDVLGECETEYHLTQPGGISINKTKHTCRYNNYLPYIPHEHYSRKELSVQPGFLPTEQSCQMSLQDRVWSRVDCVEEIKVKELKELFSSTSSSSTSSTSSLASVSVTTTLILEAGPEHTSETFAEVEGPQKRRETLRMDLEEAIRSADTYKHQDSELFEQIIMSMDYLMASMGSDSGLTEKRPHAFAHLVTLVNQLKTEVEMNEIWDSFTSQPASRQIILDAVLLCESQVCFRLLTKMAVEDQEAFPETRVLTWLAGVHFHSHPHPNSIVYLIDLAMNNLAMEKEAVMATSSLVNRLCQQSKLSCREYAQPLLVYAREKIGHSCGYGQSHEERLHVKLALKALSNAGVLPEGHFPQKCFMNKMMSPEVRISALQTYRRVDCDDLDLETPWKILEDGSDDVGVRIEAYLSVVRCAYKKPAFFTRVKNLLHKEKVNQVGSYIWTHIRNLAAKPDGNNQSRDLSSLAHHHILQAKFNTNAFRTSRNYRAAGFSKLLNIGGSLDSDLIFTPDSYIPRYESHRLHLDFLEHSIEAFEIGGDMRGLEGYIDRLFGNDGYFENKDIQTVLETLRPKRDVNDEKLEEFQMLYHEAKERSEHVEETSSKLGFFFRVFGNEIFYMDDVLESNPWRFIQKLIQEFSVPRSFQILKQEYVSPTLLGFPLRLRVNATGTVTYDHQGDLKMNSLRNFLMEGQVSASAAFSLDEMLMVEGYGSSSGVRRRSTQVANAEFGGKISVQKGKVVDVQFNIPNNELAHVSTSVDVALYQNYRQGWHEREEYEGETERSELCLPDEMSKMLGLEICSLSEHAILSGESDEPIQGDIQNSELTLTKTDSFSFYKFYFKNQGNDFQVLFDTPGSSVDRKLEFKTNLGRDRASSTLSIPGKRYDLEGQYQNTEALKRISLQFQEDSTPLGDIELSLPMTKKDVGFLYKPRFLIQLKDKFKVEMDGTVEVGTDIFTLQGNLMTSLQNRPMNFKVSWERTGDQHKIEANAKVGEMFESLSGTLFLNGEKTLVQVDLEYGANPNQPNSLSLTFDKSRMIEEGEKRYAGYLSLESSIGMTNVELEYDFSPYHVRADTNVTVMGKEVTSQLVLKNEVNDKERDFEATLSFASPQLKMNYLGTTIYKVSNNAFQTEVEVKLGSTMQSKAALTYLFDNDPLHVLGGLHFNFNDFVIQFVHELDFTQPNVIHITSSNIIGPAVGALQVLVDYDRNTPFTANFDVHAGYNNRQFGISYATSSDEQWQAFDGSLNAQWLERTYTVHHKMNLEEGKKQMTFTNDDGDLIDLTLQTEPDFVFQLLVQQNTGQQVPDYKFVVERRMEGRSTIYETYLTELEDDVFHLTASNIRDQTYRLQANIVGSQLEVNAQVVESDPDHLEASVETILTYPSGEVWKPPPVTFKHTYDGQVRELQLSSNYEEDVIDAKLEIVHRDGWFSDDLRKMTFSLITPFEGLKDLGVIFEAHSDWSEPWLAEARWEGLKVHGEIQLGDLHNLEAKLQYEDGGSCDSHLHIYHKYEGRHYVSGASLGLTNAHDPWAVEVITTKGDNSAEECSLDVNMSLQTPMLQTPFEMRGEYKLSSTHFSFEVEAGLESKTKFSFSGEKEIVSGTRKIAGALNFDSPWTEPVSFDIENYQNLDSFNVTVDLRTSWKPIQTARSVFSLDYAVPEETVSHFYFTHQDLQITMEMLHKLSKQELVQQMQASVNTMTLNYDLNVNLDEQFIPTNSEGHLSINGLFNHKLELTLSHTKENSKFNTELSGSWDLYHVYASHLLESDHPLKWKSTFQLQLSLPDENVFTIRLFINNQKDISSVESTFYVNSSWTEGFTADLEIHGEKELRQYSLEATYGDVILFNAVLHFNDSLHWDKTDISLDISSSLFDNWKLVWQHNFNSKNLVAWELSYGETFYFDGRNHLRYKQNILSQEFEGYNFDFNLKMRNPQLHFKAMFGFNDLFSGELKFNWYEYILFIKSSIPDGKVFAASFGYPGVEFETELAYEMKGTNMPAFSFHFMRNDIELFAFEGIFKAVYPEFDGLFTLQYFNEYTGISKNGRLHLTANLSQIEDYAFMGMVKLNSDFEGFENYWADIDTALNFTDMIKGHIHGQLHVTDWLYKTKLDGLINLHPGFKIEYSSEYELTYGEQLYDKKELKFMYSHSRDDVIEGQISATPKWSSSPWAAFFHINKPDLAFKAYVIPGNERKYELDINVTKTTLIVKAQREDENGSQFNFIRGNIKWTFRRVKKQFTLNLNSDFEAIKKVTGQVIIQQRRGIAANVKLRVNQKDFTGLLRYTGRGKNNGKIMLKIENEIFVPFTTNTSLEFNLKPNEIQTNLEMDVDGQKDWAKASIKGSLSESYIRLSLPLKGFSDFDLTVTVETENKYALNVDATASLFCFNFNGILNKSYDVASLSTKLDLKCSGEPLFDFNIRYNFEDRLAGEIATNLFVKSFGNLFKFEITGALDINEARYKIVSEIYPYYYHTSTFSFVTMRELFSFEIHVKDTSSEDTCFLFKTFFSDTKNEVQIEVGETKVISFIAEHDFQPEVATIDASYSHTIFGDPFNAKLTVDAIFSPDSGSLETHLSTDRSFDYVDFTVNYDARENFQGHFDLATSNGDAEGTATFEKTDVMSSLKAEMQSSLHTFQNYQLEVRYEHPANDENIYVKSIQDDVEFEMKFSKTSTEDMAVLSMDVKMPFKEFQGFDIAIGFPKQESSTNSYKTKVGFMLSNEHYELYVKHAHHESWVNQETEFSISIPLKIFGNYRISFMYDLQGQSLFHFESSKGQFELDGSWEITEQNVLFELKTDLTLFNQGQYKFKVDFPLKMYQKGEIEFSRHETDVDFVLHILVGKNYKNGEISLNIQSSGANTTTYSLMYENKKSINLQGHWDNWNVSVQTKFTGKRIPVNAGNFEISTNFEGFETINGSWDFQLKKKVYSAEITVDINQKGTIKFDGSLINQPQGMAWPWQIVIFKANFVSPFTKSHKLKAQYNLSDMSDMSMLVSYRYGAEIFQSSLNVTLTNRIGNISLKGNVPINGISTYYLDFEYNFQNSFNAGLKMQCEESFLEINFEIASDWVTGQSGISWSSPFTNPLHIIIKWSADEKPFVAEASWKYGKQEAGINLSLQYSDSSAHFDLKFITPIKLASLIHLNIMYDFSDSQDIKATAMLKIQEHLFQIESKMMLGNGNDLLKATGSMAVLGSTGSINIELENRDNTYSGKFSGQINESETIHFSLNLTMGGMQSVLKYGEEEIFVLSIAADKVDIVFHWKELYYNLNSEYRFTGKGHEIELNLKFPEMNPIAVNAIYSQEGKYEGILRVKFGERDYSIRGSLSLKKIASSIEFHFESSEDLYNPIVVSAMYDLAAFTQGKMKSKSELASASFEWGEKLTFSLKGQRRGKSTKLDLEIITPFEMLPKFCIGYEGDLIRRGSNIHLTFTAFAEWSERVAITGLFKFKNNKLNLKWTLTSPYSVIEKLAITLQHSNNHLEASVVFNRDEWEVTCDYNFSPRFAVTLSAKTPIDDFREISFNASAGVSNNKFNAKAKLVWENQNAIEIKLVAEMWYLEIYLNTPWDPLKEASLITSLRTESEELMYNLALKWSSTVADLTCVISPFGLKLVGKYVADNDEIGNVTFEYQINRNLFDFSSKMETPFEAFGSFEITLRLSFEESKLKAIIPFLYDFSIMMETKDYWKEMTIEGSIVAPYEKTPYKLKANYAVEPNNYSFLGGIEVVSVITWVSLNIDFMNERKAEATFYDGIIEIKLTNPNDGELHFDFKFSPENFNLEYLALEATANYGSNLEFLEASSVLMYKPKSKGMVRHELQLHSNVENLLLSINFKLNSDLLEFPYELKMNLPIFNIFKSDGNIEIALMREGEELYKVTYEIKYPKNHVFTHAVIVQSPNWRGELLVSLTKSNFQVSFFFPNEETKHSLVVSWPRDISLEKWALQLEASTPYLAEGDINFIVDFTTQQKFYFTLTSSLSYGSNTMDMNSKFQYRKRERKVVFEAGVISDWIGNHSTMLSVVWLRNIIANFNLNVMEQEHNAIMQIDREEYTLQCNINSPWISSEEITITAMVNKDISPNNIMFEGKFEIDNNNYSIEGKYESTDETFIKTYLIINGNQEALLKTSGLFQRDESLLDIDLEIESELMYFDYTFKFRIEDAGKDRELICSFKTAYQELGSFYINLHNSKAWEEIQSINIDLKNLLKFNFHVTLGEEEGEIELYFRNEDTVAKLEIEYICSLEYEFELHLQTPFNNLEIFDFELEWPTSRNTQKELTIYYGWYDDDISFKLNILPDKLVGWSIGAYLTTPFKGYEKFGLQTPQVDSYDQFNILIEYPNGKVGLEMHHDCPNVEDCQLTYSLHLPFENYEILSLKYAVPLRKHDRLDLEMRAGKVGFTLSVTPSRERTYVQFNTLIRINEYKSESYLRFYTFKNRYRAKLHFDFELQDLSDVKSFDFESRYDPTERLLIVARTDQDELVKVHFSWGADKIIAITTPKVYPGYLILNLESTEFVNDYKVQVGLSQSSGNQWEVYGFHIHQKQLGYGREFHLSGEAGERQFSAEGTITLNPLYLGNLFIQEKIVLELNHKQIGFATYFQIDCGFFKDTYMSDLQIMIPDQTLHWDTNATYSSRSFDMLSRFKWNEFDSEEQPISLTIKYDDVSADSQEHMLRAVFSHPEIQNLILQGNVTQPDDSLLFVVAEFVDENAPEKNILFMLNSIPGSDYGNCIIQANLSQPSSNFAIDFDAKIVESIFNRAYYELKYWSHTEQKWEVLDLTTTIDSLDHGWHFAANMNKSDSNWGYNYNGSLIYQDDLATFNIIGVSRHFMDYWRFETSVNRYLPELEMQLQVGQSSLNPPHETGRVRVGLHNPLEMGAIIDHERFGVWRQDARAGLRLRNRDLLQFLLEFDPSFDFMDKSIMYRMTSPASKISNAWLRDLFYTASIFQQWGSSEFPEALDVLFNQNTFQTIYNYEANKYESFRQDLTSTFSHIYTYISDSWSENVKPFIISSSHYTVDMYRTLEQHFAGAKYFLWNTWNKMVVFVNIEVVRFHDRMILDLDTFSVWWTETNQEMSIRFKNMMYELVRNMNTFTNVLRETLLLFQEALAPTFQSYQRAFDRYSQELEAVLGGQCWPKIQQEIERVKASLAELEYMGERFFQPRRYLVRLQLIGDEIVNWYHHTKEAFEDGLSQLKEGFRESDLFGDLVHEFQIVKQITSEFIHEGFFMTFQRRVSELGPGILAKADEVVHVLREKYIDLRENVVFDYFEAITGNAFDRMLLTWDRWRAEEYHVLDTFQRIFISLVDIFKKAVRKGFSEMEESIIFEPKVKGKIIYNQFLPVPWNNFLEEPQWFRLVNLFQKESPLLESKRKLAEGLDTVYTQVDALFIPGFFLPPFTATASVYGQQVTTFDLLHYQFLGSCSYLMTKDFVGGDFEVIGDYIRSEDGEIHLQSMMIKTQDADITLHVDGTYEVKNMGSAEVYADDHYVAFKQGSLFVTCNKLSQGCSVSVGSKYFGRLAGLLGNYNYEPSDDSDGPDGSKAQDGQDIANNWAVSSNPCYLANQVKRVDSLSQVNDFDACHELFLRSSSPFSRCFMRVDPRPYFWHCVRDQKRPDFGREKRGALSCHSADAYRTQCVTFGVRLQPLRQCPRGADKTVIDEKITEVDKQLVLSKAPSRPLPEVTLGTCEVNGETVTTGWSKTYEGQTQGSADVAFVIELANCNKGRNLQLLLRLIKVQLKRSGIQDVRYALVTTKGESVDVPPAMVSEEDLVVQLNNLVIGGPKAETGGAEAVKTAARQLKWRPGVARNLIQLPCRACDDGEAVTEALLENDVTYHILTKFKVIVNGPNAQKSRNMASKIWGYDRRRVYTPKDAKKFTGNVNLRKLLQEPEDSSCMDAVQRSGGFIFNLNKWTTKSAVIEKKYLSVIGQGVLKTSRSPECQECRCLGAGDDAGVSCRKCGGDWSALEEVQQVQQVQEISMASLVDDDDNEEEEEEEEEEQEDGGQETVAKSKNVLQDIKKNFKEQFIEENAAFAQLEKDSEDYESSNDNDDDDYDSGSEESEENEYYDPSYQYEYDDYSK